MQQLIKVSHSSMLLYQEFLMKYTLYIEICRQNILNNIKKKLSKSTKSNIVLSYAQYLED